MDWKDFHKLILIPLALVMTIRVYGQNLVPNPSFEEYTECPETANEITLASPWLNDIGGSELFHACVSGTQSVGVPENGAGVQLAHTGEGYAGIFTYGGQYETNGREYLQVPLSEPLQSGGYVISFWASLADEFQYAVGSIGAYLSDTLIIREQFNSVLEVEPSIQSPAGLIMSDKDIWYHITDTFASRYGGEQYLLIGNFKSTAESDTLLVPTVANNRFQSYYYIDDVSVVALGDTVSGVAEAEQLSFSVYPNPSTSTTTLTWQGKAQGNYQLELYDVDGRQVAPPILTKREGNWEIDMSALESGIYFGRLVVGEEMHSFKVVKE